MIKIIMMFEGEYYPQKFEDEPLDFICLLNLKVFEARRSNQLTANSVTRSVLIKTGIPGDEARKQSAL